MTQVMPPPPPPAPESKPEIKTDKYGDLIPISKADYEALRDWIAKDRKLVYPIIINQHGDVLDGHNRFKICQELGIEPRIEIKDCDDELEEKEFVYFINLKRRHMNDFQKIKIALKAKADLEETAKCNMSLGGKGVKPIYTLGRVDDELVKKFDLKNTTTNKPYSHMQIHKVQTIIEKGSDEVQKRLEENKTSIAEEYNKIIRAQKRIKSREEAEAFAKTLGRQLPHNVTVLNKDSTNVDDLTEIPDNSVDLIITDPPYLKEYLSVFEGVAKLAVRKLKEGGSLIFYYGHPHLPEIISLFSKYEEEGLHYAWQLAVLHTGSQARFHCLGLQVGWKPMLWYKRRKKGDKMRYDSHKPAWQPDFCDVIKSAPPNKTRHDWAQSPVEAEYVIEHLTINEHSLVVDPFLGSGAFGIAATKLNRYFVGIDIDKQTCESAKNYIISETQ